MKLTTLVLVTALLGSACGAADSSTAASDAHSSADATDPVWFEESAAARGIRWTHRSGHRDRYLLPEIMGGGAALFDMDGDGDLDLYLVQSGSVTESGAKNPSNRLFRNRGDGTFEDVTAGSGADASGYGMGVAAGDYDNDGDPDLLVTNFGPNVLLRNDGDGRFTDVTAAAGVGGRGWHTGAAFVDYDADGDLDIFVLRYINWSAATELPCFSLMGGADYCSPRNYDAPLSDVLYRNDGNGTFSDVSAAAGLHTAFGNGLGVVVTDVNGDGRPDVFVANDAMPNQLWINEGDGRFVDRALVLGVAVDEDGSAKSGMGVDASDVDDDGDQDLLVVNLDGESDSFFRNDGAFFSDATAAVGLRAASRQFTRFGTAFIDFDNDGRLDLYQANGRVGQQALRYTDDPYAEPSLLFRGLPGGRFEEVAPRGGTAHPLLASARAAAFGDIDNDGGVDIVVVNRDHAPYVLHNVVGSRGHWIAFRAVEPNGRDSFGARITMRSGARTITREVRAAYSYLASNDPRVHIGLGEQSRVMEVRVRWPNGDIQEFGEFPANQVITLSRVAR
ncbi:MAG TPA: CRTAC1 family protein [Vicinamibacterales bacterium]|nr:CRTAC1 family protein [Vicinamibacterales bacterium]